MFELSSYNDIRWRLLFNIILYIVCWYGVADDDGTLTTKKCYTGIFVLKTPIHPYHIYLFYLLSIYYYGVTIHTHTHINIRIVNDISSFKIYFTMEGVGSKATTKNKEIFCINVFNAFITYLWIILYVYVYGKVILWRMFMFILIHCQ